MKNDFLNEHNFKSTEEFLKTVPPPIHTCAPAEGFVKDFLDVSNYFIKLEKELKDIPTCQIHGDKYRYYVNLIDCILEKISTAREEIEVALDLIESFRKNSLSRREAVKEIKNDFWDLYFKKEYKELTLPKKVYLYEEWVYNFDFYHEITPFEEDCSFVDLFPSISEISINFEIMKDLYVDLFTWGNEICLKGSEKLKENSLSADPSSEEN